MNIIGDKIYYLRKQCGLSQEELGFELGVSRQTISKWETGTAIPDSKNLIQLSEYFNLSVESLYVSNEEQTGENASTKSLIDTNEQEGYKKKNKSILLKILLSLLIMFALGLVLVIALIGASIYSSFGDNGVESVSLVLFNLSLLDVLFISIASFLIVIILIFLICFIIHKNNIKK